MLAVAGCTALRANTSGRWLTCCQPTRCSALASSTMPSGAAPHTGAFVIVHEESPLKKAQLAYYKLGNGPFYVFYTPFHLPHIQIASTIGRAVIHRDPTVAPIAGPVCEVVTVAKRDLKAGEHLDGIGGFCTYGLIDNAAAARAMAALPIGLSEGCVLRRDVSKDDVLSFDDVDAPSTARSRRSGANRTHDGRFPARIAGIVEAASARRGGAREVVLFCGKFGMFLSWPRSVATL